QLGLGRGQPLAGHYGFTRTTLQLLAERRKIRLRGGELLLQFPRGPLPRREFLPRGLHLFLALGEQRLLLAAAGAGLLEFAEQAVAVFLFLVERQPHHGREVLAAVRLVRRGRQVELQRTRRRRVGHLVDVHR